MTSSVLAVHVPLNSERLHEYIQLLETFLDVVHLHLQKEEEKENEITLNDSLTDVLDHWLR